MKKLVAVALGVCIALITCGVVMADELVPAEWEPEAGPYLARGTWAFSGTGTITVDGVTMSAVITKGIARIFSDGGAGLEIVTRIEDSGDVRYSHDGEIILEDSFEANRACDKLVVDNRLKLDGSGQIWDIFLLGSSSGKLHAYGAYVDDNGHNVDFDYWYTAGRVSYDPNAEVGGSGGGGCSVGADPAWGAVLLMPLLLLKLRSR